MRVRYWELGTGARCVTGSLIAQLHQELIELGGFGIAVTQYLLRRDGVLASEGRIGQHSVEAFDLAFLIPNG